MWITNGTVDGVETGDAYLVEASVGTLVEARQVGDIGKDINQKAADELPWMATQEKSCFATDPVSSQVM